MTSRPTYHRFDDALRRRAATLPDDIPGTLAVFAQSVSLKRGSEPVEEAYFEIYRSDRVSLTSILFSGGDWRWRFCAPDGRTIASSVGYSSERDCANAVAALRASARTASIRS